MQEPIEASIDCIKFLVYVVNFELTWPNQNNSSGPGLPLGPQEVLDWVEAWYKFQQDAETTISMLEFADACHNRVGMHIQNVEYDMKMSAAIQLHEKDMHPKK